MEIRRLLNKYHIPWKDAGKNCSTGWVNIQCPFCRDDPSEHLRISEEMTGFYCLRNLRHKGALYLLFQKLGIPESEIGAPKQLEYKKEDRSKNERDYSGWQHFESALKNAEALEYLYKRNFRFPNESVSQFNLRVATEGKWAGRLLIPLTKGWTGRSMRPHIEPRYLSYTDESGFFLAGSGLTGFLVEGPIDAMKIAASVTGYTSIAMTGGNISPSLLCFLREKKFQVLHSVPDNNVSLSQRTALLLELRASLPYTEVKNTKLPTMYKDSGEMTIPAVQQWIFSLLK